VRGSRQCAHYAACGEKRVTTWSPGGEEPTPSPTASTHPRPRAPAPSARSRRVGLPGRRVQIRVADCRTARGAARTSPGLGSPDRPPDLERADRTPRAPRPGSSRRCNTCFSNKHGLRSKGLDEPEQVTPTALRQPDHGRVLRRPRWPPGAAPARASTRPRRSTRRSDLRSARASRTYKVRRTTSRDEVTSFPPRAVRRRDTHHEGGERAVETGGCAGDRGARDVQPCVGHLGRRRPRRHPDHRRRFGRLLTSTLGAAGLNDFSSRLRGASRTRATRSRSGRGSTRAG
jgi:hypothetical protein